MAHFRALALAAAFLLLAAPSVVQAQEDETLGRDLAAIIDMYLSGKADAGELKAIDISDNLAKGSLPPEDPYRRLFALLGGVKDVDCKKIAVQANSRPDLWALASMALFVRTLATSPALDSDLVSNSLVNYREALASGASSAAASKWRERIPAWLAWSGSSFAMAEGLEPLLRKRSRDPKAEIAVGGFDEISTDDFVKSRQACAARPKPDGLSFQQTAMDRYFNSIENDALRELERARYNYIKDVKSYLIRIFVRSPYSGRVKLSKNRQPAGTVALANEKFFLVRDSNTEKSVKCEWEEVLPEQFSDFLSYYAKMRIKISGPNLSEADKRRQAADDLAHAAVLCDWYGRYQDAIDYAKLATRISPDIKPELLKILLGR